MTSTDNRSRQPAGVSTGGQFATETKGEAPVTLAGTAPSAPAPAPLGETLGGFASEQFTGAVADFREAKNLKEFADAVLTTYPGAVAIRPDFDEGTSYTEYVLADGTANAVFLDEDGTFDGEPPMLYPHESAILHGLAEDRTLHEEHGQVKLTDIDGAYVRSEQRYTEALAAALMPAWAPRTVQRVPELPEQVPAGHRITTDLDGDGDGRAILAGANGEPIAVVVDDPSADYPIRAVDEGAPAWANDHREAIADELQVAAANYRNLSEQLAEHVGSIPAIHQKLEDMATGRQD
ncbi:hypothetical protein LG293_17030 (plasmid) [Citricoccus nitrophenolicus]